MIPIIKTTVGAVQEGLCDLLEELDGYQRVCAVDGAALVGELGRQLAATQRHRAKLRKTSRRKPEPLALPVRPPGCSASD